MCYSAKKVAVAMLIVFVGLCSKTSAQGLRVGEVFLKADDGRLSGPCPMKVVFHGYITANGPGIVEYTFTRSDGAAHPVVPLEFDKAGSQSVETSWTLGDAGTYKGWQAIKIVSPNQIESSHETGSFTVMCVESAEKPIVGSKDFTKAQALDPPVVGAASDLDAKPQLPAQGFPLGFTTVALPQNPVDAFGTRSITARLTVRNKASDPILVRLQFVDGDGKVLVVNDSSIQPGKDGTIVYKFPNDPTIQPGVDKGSISKGKLQAQLRIKEKHTITELEPTLEIVDDKTGSLLKTVGAEGFTEFIGPTNPLGRNTRPDVRAGLVQVASRELPSTWMPRYANSRCICTSIDACSLIELHDAYCSPINQIHPAVRERCGRKEEI